MREAIDKTCVVPARRVDVWAALTTAAGVSGFLGSPARIDLRVGGPYEIAFDGDAETGDRGSEGCTVLSYLAPEMLAFTWNAPPSIPTIRHQRTQVVITLAESAPGETHVHLVNDGYGDGPDWDEAWSYFDRAWGFVLERLVAHIGESRAAAAVPELESPAVDWPRYLATVVPARTDFFDSGPTEHERDRIGAHFAYLQSLRGQGRLILAGRASGGALGPPPETSAGIPLNQGLIVFTARDDEHARRTFDADPAVAAGVFHGQVTRYGVALIRDAVRRDEGALMRSIRTLITAVLLALAALAPATVAEPEAQPSATEPSMQLYYMAFLYRAEQWTAEPTEEVIAISKAHRASMRRHAEAGKLILAGPFIENPPEPGGLAGIFIFDVPSLEEAQALCAEDPAVKAGRFRIEVKTWYGPTGLTYDGADAGD